MAHALDYGKYARGLLIRRTYPELEEVERRCHEIYPYVRAVWQAMHRTWLFPGGGLLRLRHLNRDEDANQYQGWSTTWVGIDELGNFAAAAPIDKLRATLRSAHGVPCYFRATANPGGKGHAWIKARYIDPMPPMTEYYDPEAKTFRLYIPSTLDDNLILTEHDPLYWQRVEASAAGNAELLKAWRYGFWDIALGAFFADIWEHAIHVIPPFRIPPNWRVDRSHDWGESRPFCTLWFAESNGEAVDTSRGTQCWPKGTLFVIAEDYGWNGKPNEGIRLPARGIAQRIRQAEAAMGYKVHPGPADLPAMQNGQSVEADMAQMGVRWDKPPKGPGSRVTGWSALRGRLAASLKQPMEEPGLFVWDTCRHVIRTVPVLPRDEKTPDDCDSEAEDHAADALRLRCAVRDMKLAVGRMRV
jgi:hypothetical protein